MSKDPADKNKAFYPVNLDITGRRCLVIGGGKVAARKVSSLLASGAVVRVVSPEACAGIRQAAAAGELEWVGRTFEEHDVEGAFLVFAATSDRATQRRVAGLAKARGILLNSADSPLDSDFHVPAAIRRGDLIITVSTSGSSPALSGLLRQRLSGEFGPEYALLVTLMAGIRRQVVGRAVSSDENRELFHRLLAAPLLEKIRVRDWDGLEGLIASLVPAEIDCRNLVADLKEVEKTSV